MFIKEHSVSEATKNALHCKISDNEKEQARPFYITKAWATKKPNKKIEVLIYLAAVASSYSKRCGLDCKDRHVTGSC